VIHRTSKVERADLSRARSGRRTFALAVAALGLAGSLLATGTPLGAGSAGADTTQSALQPRLGAEPSSVPSGTRVTVNANSLTPQTNFQLQVCGNAGFGTSADCSLASATTAATSEYGHFVVRFLVVTPPTPCPCVIKAVPLVGQYGEFEQQVSTPITIIGARMVTPRAFPIAVAPSGLVVDRADLVGTTSWAEWFGGTPHRTLVLVVRDGGVDPIPSTPVVLRSGPSGSPDQVVASPVVPPLQPGQVESYQVAVTFPALAHGHYVVAGTLGSAGQFVTFSSPATFVPWGFVVVVGLLLLAILVKVVAGVVRRRRQGGPAEGVPPVAEGAPPAPTETAGLVGAAGSVSTDAASLATVPSGADPVEVP